MTLLTPSSIVEEAAHGRGLSPKETAALVATRRARSWPMGSAAPAGEIGVLIAMSSIIGAALLESGGADRIVRSARRVLGERRAPAAFLGRGLLLGVPVFFATVFYMRVPLAKAIHIRHSGRQYLAYVLAIVAGGTMAHSLVPPTPEHVVANAFGVSLAVMSIGGCIVGGCAAAVGFAYARWADRRWPVPLREPEAVVAELNESRRPTIATCPRCGSPCFPILLPMVLITLQATAASATGRRTWDVWLRVIGDKNIAVGAGAVIALLMLWRAGPAARVHRAVTTSAPGRWRDDPLITGAGGAFGGALQQSGLGSIVQRLVARPRPSDPAAGVPFDRPAGAALGSATVAMITASGAFAGLASAGHLPFHPVYLALAIGCGSKPIWWMNDSGFWVVTQMSGLTEREGLMHLTPMSILMGITGLLVTMLGATLVPLV